MSLAALEQMEKFEEESKRLKDLSLKIKSWEGKLLLKENFDKQLSKMFGSNYDEEHSKSGIDFNVIIETIEVISD